jgi:SAM-dependent methyltransferase
VSDTSFQGSIPELYDELFVPLLFAPYARDVAALVADGVPHDVLETCAGTGALTRELVSKLPAARIVATDLNAPMVERGQRVVPGATWRTADALALPFEDATFDAVVSQFGVMFFPDKAAGHREARRVLRPGGAYVVATWDRIEDNELTDVVTKALAEVFPNDPPAFMARTPHGYFDEARIREDFRAGGWPSVRIEKIVHTSRAPSAQIAATAFCQGTPLRNEIDARDASRLAEATERTAEALAARFGHGAIEGKISALIASAKR